MLIKTKMTPEEKVMAFDMFCDIYDKSDSGTWIGDEIRKQLEWLEKFYAYRKSQA